MLLKFAGRAGALAAACLLLLIALVSPARTDGGVDIAAGERLFRNQCMGCHSVERDVNRAGPSLYGLFGRRSGTLEGFAYSRAMADADIVWSAETLDGFLGDPSAVVPGTKMVFWGLEAEQRARIIAYLSEATQSP